MKKSNDPAFIALAVNTRLLREARSWSQEKLAEQAGVSMSAIQRLEAQQRWPKPVTLSAIARVLQCPVSRLFMERKESPPSPRIRELDELLSQLEPGFADTLMEIIRNQVRAAGPGKAGRT